MQIIVVMAYSNSGTECESETEFMSEGLKERTEGSWRRSWRWKRFSKSYSVTPAGPRDRGHVVYVCMVMAGAGFLFPWSSYITAIDYFFFLYQRDFPQVFIYEKPNSVPELPPSQVSVTIPMTYLIFTWLFTGFNTSLVSAVPLHVRIGLGYALFLLSLIAIPLLDLLVHSCVLSIHGAYYLTILSIAVVGIGSGG